MASFRDMIEYPSLMGSDSTEQYCNGFTSLIEAILRRHAPTVMTIATVRVGEKVWIAKERSAAKERKYLTAGVIVSCIVYTGATDAESSRERETEKMGGGGHSQPRSKNRSDIGLQTRTVRARERN